MYQKDTIKIFTIEDDPAYLKFLEYVLGLNPDFEVSFFETGKSALAHLHENPDIITLDYSLPDISGDEVLKQIKEYNPDIPVIIISGQEEIGTAVNLLKAGAFDYITKDEETKDRILYAITNARKNVKLIKEINNSYSKKIPKAKSINKKYDNSKKQSYHVK
jgi:DNA-binding NtrC family response regulator